MILILGKGLTADYTNNADGEGIEMNDESISGGSNVEYQVRIDFRNPCYPRNPWSNLFCDKRSYFRGRHRAEEYPQHLFLPNHADQFVHRAIHGNKDEQNDLDSPEMRPDDF